MIALSSFVVRREPASSPPTFIHLHTAVEMVGWGWTILAACGANSKLSGMPSVAGPQSSPGWPSNTAWSPWATSPVKPTSCRDVFRMGLEKKSSPPSEKVSATDTLLARLWSTTSLAAIRCGLRNDIHQQRVPGLDRCLPERLVDDSLRHRRNLARGQALETLPTFTSRSSISFSSIRFMSCPAGPSGPVVRARNRKNRGGKCAYPSARGRYRRNAITCQLCFGHPISKFFDRWERRILQGNTSLCQHVKQ